MTAGMASTIFETASTTCEARRIHVLARAGCWWRCLRRTRVRHMASRRFLARKQRLSSRPRKDSSRPQVDFGASRGGDRRKSTMVKLALGRRLSRPVNHVHNVDNPANREHPSGVAQRPCRSCACIPQGGRRPPGMRQRGSGFVMVPYIVIMSGLVMLAAAFIGNVG